MDMEEIQKNITLPTYTEKKIGGAFNLYVSRFHNPGKLFLHKIIFYQCQDCKNIGAEFQIGTNEKDDTWLPMGRGLRILTKKLIDVNYEDHLVCCIDSSPNLIPYRVNDKDVIKEDEREGSSEDLFYHIINNKGRENINSCFKNSSIKLIFDEIVYDQIRKNLNS
ncbi:MAG: hypothetical protein KKA64_00945 [Nanoarchaeota archaeon]|nr:hypothetical protein [Nanoarchaeota archaeon]